MINPLTRLDQADAIERSAGRLKRLCDVNAPGVVLERERQILFTRLMTFPVDSDAAQEIASMDSETQSAYQKQVECQHETGTRHKEIDPGGCGFYLWTCAACGYTRHDGPP
jgi:rubrerythrin